MPGFAAGRTCFACRPLQAVARRWPKRFFFVSRPAVFRLWKPVVQDKYRPANGERGDGHEVSSRGGVLVSDVAARRARAWALRRCRFSRSAVARRCSRSDRSSLVGRGGPADVLLMRTMKNGMNSARQAMLASRATVVRWSGNIGAAVAQGQSTPLVRVGSVVQFHSAAPSLKRAACPGRTVAAGTAPAMVPFAIARKAAFLTKAFPA